MDMSGCNDPGTGEATEAGFRSRIIDGAVGGTRGRRDPGDGGGTGDESVTLFIEPSKVAS